MTAVWVGVLLALVALAYYGMWRGWRNRSGRQSDLDEPIWLDGVLGTSEIAEGTYVSTTTAGDWLDRITAHGLGALSKASIGVLKNGDLAVIRHGESSFQIPASALVGVRLERGIAGKVREPDGIVVITWMLGQRELDTGFRPEHKADADAIASRIARMTEDAHHG